MNAPLFYLKPFILENFLNCHHLLRVNEASLVDHAKGAISNDLNVCVGHFLRAVRALAGGGYHRRHFAAVSCGQHNRNDLACLNHIVTEMKIN